MNHVICFAKLVVESCTCGVKTYDHTYHDEACRYRLLHELRETYEQQLSTANRCLVMQQNAAIDLSQQLAAAMRVVIAFNVCDQNRGWLSCTHPHDCRCPKAFKKTTTGDGQCICGYDELYEALDALDKGATQ